MRLQGGAWWRRRFLASGRLEPNGGDGVGSGEWHGVVLCLVSGVVAGQQPAERLEEWTVIWGVGRSPNARLRGRELNF